MGIYRAFDSKGRPLRDFDTIVDEAPPKKTAAPATGAAVKDGVQGRANGNDRAPALPSLHPEELHNADKGGKPGNDRVKGKRGPKPSGKALTPAEKQRAYRARKKQRS